MINVCQISPANKGRVMNIIPILTKKAPRPAGHYSQGLRVGDLIYISGQLPIDPETGEKNQGSIEQQTERVLNNILAIAEAGGSELSGIIKITVYLSDIELWERMNLVYSKFFDAHKPARTAVPVSALHWGFKIEMDAVAAVTEKKT